MRSRAGSALDLLGTVAVVVGISAFLRPKSPRSVPARPRSTPSERDQRSPRSSSARPVDPDPHNGRSTANATTLERVARLLDGLRATGRVRVSTKQRPPGNGVPRSEPTARTPGRVADNCCTWLDILGHDGTGADDRLSAYSNATQNSRAGPDRGAPFDHRLQRSPNRHPTAAVRSLPSHAGTCH